MRNLIIIIGFVMLVFTGCTGSESKTPEQLVESYFNAALKGNLDEANSYFSKQASKYEKESKYNKVNGFNKSVKDNTAFDIKIIIVEKWKDDNNFKVLELFIKNKTALTSYLKEYKKSRGETVPNIRFQLKKQNGKWVIEV